YVRRPELEIATDKLAFLSTSQFKDIPFDRIQPDKNHNWLNIADNDFEELLPLANKETKLAKSEKEERAFFKLFFNGFVTASDEWVYDFSQANLAKKVNYFCRIYEQEKVRWNQSNQKVSINNFVDRTLKWTSELETHLQKASTLEFNSNFARESLYRPFIKRVLYFDRIIVHRIYQQGELFKFGKTDTNKLICFSGLSSTKPFQSLITKYVAGFDFLEKTQCLPLYRYNKQGNRTDNITDWGLNQFRTHYIDSTITKENIFHYTYAVLHHPAYREKYALNLKREFPRLPFYEDFHQWVAWGKQLMDFHLNYETVKKYPLKRIDKPLASNKANKPKLKADKEGGKIPLDDITILQGIPAEAWDYKLGNRSAIEWILDQYKEKKPRDKTIAEKFNSYHFADYKESVIELLQRVCTVSVETMRIIGEMP
ncbi:MAG: type ISP restriction/modification enzyme, partial [Candidatus Parabeggiatoa sp.]|nr:type ISP restriction/modification enzyme [Candidatus Parabeggiatoa sp.]